MSLLSLFKPCYMASTADFPFSRFYFIVFALVRLSESGSVWESRSFPAHTCSLGGTKRKREGTLWMWARKQNKSRLTRNKASLRDRWPPIMLHLVPTYCKHSVGLIDWPTFKMSFKMEQRQASSFCIWPSSWMNTPGGWAAEQLALHFMIVRKPPYNRDKQEGSSTEKGDSQQKKQEEEDEKRGMGVRKDFF